MGTGIDYVSPWIKVKPMVSIFQLPVYIISITNNKIMNYIFAEIICHLTMTSCVVTFPVMPLAMPSYCFWEAITTNFIATGLTAEGVENGTTPINCNNLFLRISSGSKCLMLSNIKRIKFYKSYFVKIHSYKSVK